MRGQNQNQLNLAYDVAVCVLFFIDGTISFGHFEGGWTQVLSARGSIVGLGLGHSSFATCTLNEPWRRGYGVLHLSMRLLVSIVCVLCRWQINQVNQRKGNVGADASWVRGHCPQPRNMRSNTEQGRLSKGGHACAQESSQPHQPQRSITRFECWCHSSDLASSLTFSVRSSSRIYASRTADNIS